MSNTSTITPNIVLINNQIPISEVDAENFKKAIKNNPTKCSINGARVKKPNQQGVNVDVSFKIIEDLDAVNPGTSITGKTLNEVNNNRTLFDKYNKKSNVKGKNVTLNFDVIKHEEKGVIEVINEHELYNILAIVLKSKGYMKNTDDGSIRTCYLKLNSLLKNGVVYLKTVPVLSQDNKCYLEVNAMAGETQ